MSVLMKIQSFIQAFVLATASILEADVTVVDEDLIRVGGSGDYSDNIGEKISNYSFFQGILSSGKPGIIRNVREDHTCSICENRDTCKELASLSYPVFHRGQAVGVIGVITFSEQGRRKLLNDAQKLEKFLKYMCVLIESKIMTLEHSHKLESQLQEELSVRHSDADFIGQNPRILEILELTKRIGASDSTVLITGESGTGKEVLAKLLHSRSPRHNKLMISINCGGIPENLVESELFGYEEGAFTGARKSGHIGKFELANCGTIFLDEIGEMPLHMQIKLLRVLQERVVERVGGKTQIPIDVRVICATNRDLAKMVAERRFREDLYYRLNVIPIELPPLRERREDIHLLAQHFIKQCNRRMNKSIRSIEPEVARILSAYNWPGNVRELRNIIEYLENVAEGDTICLSDLPARFLHRRSPDRNRTLTDMLQEYEQMLLSELCKEAHTAQDKGRLAKQLGLSRATLYRKLSTYNLL